MGAAPDRPFVASEVAEGRFLLVSGQTPVSSGHSTPGPIGENYQFNLDLINGLSGVLPGADLHLLETGHFGLETHGDEIAGLISNFLSRKVR